MDSRGPSPTPAVTVALINYRGRGYLPELLESLQRQTFQDFEAVFIDNASGDGSVEFVRRHHPWIELWPQESNLGFARAGNMAARRSSAEYIVLLNTDLRLAPEWLAELLSVARSSPDTAAVAPKMLLYDRPELLNGIGGAMNRVGYTWDRGMFEEDLGQYDHSDEVLFASAAASLFRRRTFLDAGGFDERFFMYHEDVDLGWRLWILGHRIATAPKAVVLHHFGGATRQDKGMKWRELLGERNNIRSLLKNYEAKQVLKALRELVGLRQSPRRKWGQLGNLLWNCFWLPETYRLRRSLQKRRRRSDDQLKRLIVQSADVPVRL